MNPGLEPGINKNITYQMDSIDQDHFYGQYKKW